VKLWEVGTWRERAFLLQTSGYIEALSFSPDAKTLALVNDNNTAVKLWDTAANREVGRLEGAQYPVAFSRDGKTLATGSPGHNLKLWDVATQQEVVTLKGHESFLNSVAFSPDDQTLATGSADTTVRLWRAAPFAETDAPAGEAGRHAARGNGTYPR
jgi:WD40 repeat protein